MHILNSISIFFSLFSLFSLFLFSLFFFLREKARQYQTKLKDVVAAYKDLQATRKKLETALESQQDAAAQRSREQVLLFPFSSKDAESQ